MSIYRRENIRFAQEMFGISSQELAAKSGISQSTISGLNTGRIEFSEHWAERLSDTLGLPESFFDAALPSDSTDSLTFRTKSRIGKRAVRRVEREFSLLRHAVHQLTRHINGRFPTTDWILDLSPTSSPRQPDIESIANEAREYLSVGFGPIGNMTALLEEHGVIVASLSTQFPADKALADGVTKPGFQPVVGFLPTEDGDRLRFTLAHELGHLILQARRKPSNPKEGENAANLFAGAFLFPKVAADACLTPNLQLSNLLVIKRIWNISLSALITRMTRLGIISSDRQRILMIELSQNGWRKNEPYSIEPERPVLLNQICGDVLGTIITPSSSRVSPWAIETVTNAPFTMVSKWCDGGLIPIENELS